MVVIVRVGRRIPRSWFRKGLQKAAGIISFQEHIWQIVKQSLNLAKKKCNSSNTGMKFVMTTDTEFEDINYQIDWLKCTIQGTEEQEIKEYREAQGMYTPFNKLLLKKEIPKDDRLGQHFKTKVLTNEQVQQAYLKGYGAVSDNNISNKLLEMGILTHIELIDDHKSRSPV